MPSLDWQLIAEIATTVSTLAFAASAIVVVMQLRQAARERYFSVTSHLFDIWQSPEFQHDQLFLLHKLASPSWEEFCKLGRGEHAERAIHRVGGYYDRVGNLVRHRLIQKQDILPTIGGYAVAVWHRIEPLVKELRLRENAVLFENYEWLLPECHECYVPGLKNDLGLASVLSMSTTDRELVQVCEIPQTPAPEQRPASAVATAQPNAAGAEINGGNVEMATGNSNADTGAPAAFRLQLPDSDDIVHDLSEFTASGSAVLVYVRGAWCPFCLRQLSDYAERYREFKQSGVEVFAISPESVRKSRRLRTGLKLPFTVLSDAKFEAARNFGLIGHEKPGQPTPATLVLDGNLGVSLSTLNEGAKCLFARDTLEYVRALRQGTAPHSVPRPEIESPKPGILFAKALANMAAGFVTR
jgi:peroxiredoxin